MYFKCIFEDGTESYKKLEETHLRQIINEDALKEFISECSGEEIDDWDFGYSPYRDHVNVDFQKEKNLLDLIDPNLVIDEKPVAKLEFLEKSSYEHVIASLSIDEPKDLYKKKITYYASQKEEEFAEYDDPYSDEPPDYD